MTHDEGGNQHALRARETLHLSLQAQDRQLLLFELLDRGVRAGRELEQPRARGALALLELD